MCVCKLRPQTRTTMDPGRDHRATGFLVAYAGCGGFPRRTPALFSTERFRIRCQLPACTAGTPFASASVTVSISVPASPGLNRRAPVPLSAAARCNCGCGPLLVCARLLRRIRLPRNRPPSSGSTTHGKLHRSVVSRLQQAREPFKREHEGRCGYPVGNSAFLWR
jgi:hypothetical protein